MCGIFGYIGSKKALKVVFEGLHNLEYRGYDSAGVASIREGRLLYWKEVGSVSDLEKKVPLDLSLDMAIGHTRWATHGKPSIPNAHPHFDEKKSVAVIHNGIIENHEALRKYLESKGVTFSTETDTEVVACLISHYYEGDFLKAVQRTVANLKGAYALAIIHKDFPDRILAVAHESPLVIGIGEGESFLSSDSHGFINHTRKVVFLSNNELAIVFADRLEIFDATENKIEKTPEELSHHIEEVTKGEFDHYTLKEIFEQPQAVRQALLSRVIEEYGTATFEEINFDINAFQAVERLLIIGCGTSYHAALIGAAMMEEKARLPSSAEIASEFRYRNPIVGEHTLAIAISQSGETADTLAAVRELKAKGAKVLGFCNSYGSTLTRLADATIFLRAGTEVGVCSTKAFVNQVVTLSLFTLLMARLRNMSREEGQLFIEALEALPSKIEEVLDTVPHIEAVAKKYAAFENFFFIGRQYLYPASLEGALKLKEISYLQASGYPAGEMKHGPIALIDENCPTIALMANKKTASKLASNLMEIKARGGKVLAIAEEGMEAEVKRADDVIFVPATLDELAVIPTTVVTQLLAYYIAKERGANIDRPRNLAKSVTVE